MRAFEGPCQVPKAYKDFEVPSQVPYKAYKAFQEPCEVLGGFSRGLIRFLMPLMGLRRPFEALQGAVKSTKAFLGAPYKAS